MIEDELKSLVKSLKRDVQDLAVRMDRMKEVQLSHAAAIHHLKVKEDKQEPKHLELWKPDPGIAFLVVGDDGTIWNEPTERADGQADFGNCFAYGNRVRAEQHSTRLGVFNRLWRLAEQCELISGSGYVICFHDLSVWHTEAATNIFPIFKNEADAQLVIDCLSDGDKAYLKNEGCGG